MNQKSRLLLYLVLGGGVIATQLWQVHATKARASYVVASVKDAQGEQVTEIVSARFTIDGLYKSMEGPWGVQEDLVFAEEVSADETLWLTGIETSLEEDQSGEEITPEFFCHSNLTLTKPPEELAARFNGKVQADWRLFTLVPGRMKIDLPEGFALPIKADTPLEYLTMALNMNTAAPDQDIRMRTKVKTLTQAAAKAHGQSITPVFRRSLYIYQQHVPNKMATVAVAPQANHQGQFCAEACEQDRTSATPSTFVALPPVSKKPDPELMAHPGATCCVRNASQGGVMPQFGDRNTIHWMVPPGVHQYRTEVTEQMQLPWDTTAHYVTGHLHPHGRYLRFVDLETKEVVFEITSKDYPDRPGVMTMSEIESQAGVTLKKGHRYELIAEYDNPTSVPVDAMAILYIYAVDKDAVTLDL